MRLLLPRPFRSPLRRARRSLALRWVAVAGGAALVAIESASIGAAARAERDRWGAAVPVAVAVVALDAGDVVGPDDVAVELRPVAVVPEGALGEAPVGRTVAADVLAGEVLVETRVPAGGLVPPGWLAIAVPASPAPPVGPGDRVEVLAPDVVAEDAVVVHVAGDVVTIAVPARDAPAVAEAATVAFVVLALKPYG